MSKRVIKLSQNETLILVQNLLKGNPLKVRTELHLSLSNAKINEGAFYDCIAFYQDKLSLTSDEWLELLIRLPNRVLWSQIDIKNKLSEKQQRELVEKLGD